jgi:hypothetical protein
MSPDMLDSERLSQVIAHATAPAFLLGAVAGFISILIGRMTALIDRIRNLSKIADAEVSRLIPRLKRRKTMLNDAIGLALASGICTTLLLILAFATALLGIRHEYGVAILFIVAVGLLGMALFRFAHEVTIARHDFEHYG